MDGMIDTHRIKANYAERYAVEEQFSILDPDAIAADYASLGIRCKAVSPGMIYTAMTR